MMKQGELQSIAAIVSRETIYSRDELMPLVEAAIESMPFMDKSWQIDNIRSWLCVVELGGYSVQWVAMKVRQLTRMSWSYRQGLGVLSYNA